MKKLSIKHLLVSLLLLLCFSSSYAQDLNQKNLSINDLFDLLMKNNPTLNVSKADIQKANQEVKIAKDLRLPNLSANASAMYIGDATIIDKDFSKVGTVNMPHFENIYAVEASQLIWKGGAITQAIHVKSLQEELANLQYNASEQQIKLLTLGYYLDLFKLQNQAEVYQKNIALAEQRMSNINRFFKEGMITRNDVIRGELQISNLNLALQVLNNNIDILNKQLCVALGLPEQTRIYADEQLLTQDLNVAAMDYYRSSIKNHPNVQATEKTIEIFETAKKITRSERMPALAAFAGNTLQRPITTSTPALNMYSNAWNVGVSLKYDIGSLYRNSKKVQLNNLEIEQAKARNFETQEMIGIAVNAAYIKYNEALSQNATFEKNKSLASENYRIMESKYNNQLAILLDLIDASNAKLDAELQYTNSEVHIIFAYYKLLKESGNL